MVEEHKRLSPGASGSSSYESVKKTNIMTQTLQQNYNYNL